MFCASCLAGSWRPDPQTREENCKCIFVPKSPSGPERCLGPGDVPTGRCPPGGNAATWLGSVRGEENAQTLSRERGHGTTTQMPASLPRGDGRAARRGGDVPPATLIMKAEKAGGTHASAPLERPVRQTRMQPFNAIIYYTTERWVCPQTLGPRLRMGPGSPPGPGGGRRDPQVQKAAGLGGKMNLEMLTTRL